MLVAGDYKNKQQRLFKGCRNHRAGSCSNPSHRQTHPPAPFSSEGREGGGFSGHHFSVSYACKVRGGKNSQQRLFKGCRNHRTGSCSNPSHRQTHPPGPLLFVGRRRGRVSRASFSLSYACRSGAVKTNKSGCSRVAGTITRDHSVIPRTGQLIPPAPFSSEGREGGGFPGHHLSAS